MIVADPANPAEAAALEAEARVFECLRKMKSFVLEAGAGAGKTYSLVSTLEYLLVDQGKRLRRQNQRIACITYTNAAAAVISGRIDKNPLVFIDTIHAFCWLLIKGFQPMLRGSVGGLHAWQAKLAAGPTIDGQEVAYDLGYRRISEQLITLHHDDVLALTAILMTSEKFKSIVAGRFPFLLIDEYQDASIGIMSAIKENLLGRTGGPMVGLFGDHWQRIYDGTCGHVVHEELTEIGKRANFRSATSVVRVLNRMRPMLAQAVKNEAFVGSAQVFHANAWLGVRRTGAGGGHWTGDLPADVAHQHLSGLIERLKAEGWDFVADKTKILMLTHNILAAEQGYSNLADVFQYSDQYLEKRDDYIAFFAGELEPLCEAYQRRRYGKMFELWDKSTRQHLSSHSDKSRIAAAVKVLTEKRLEWSVGDLICHIRATNFPELPDAILKREDDADAVVAGNEISAAVMLTRRLRAVAYREVIELLKFVDGHTPFATKHSVKGDQFENVLVVLGRGWNRYNFDQFLQWIDVGVPTDRLDSFERNRNLFYVCCSRATTRLALLFTQQLTDGALRTLRTWFGAANVNAFTPSPQLQLELH
jgi:DNA helicase-2/ATP-dependent DNA helicase PcrA